MDGKKWVRFVRVYGPVPTKDNVYDEHLRRTAKRLGVERLRFQHPYEKAVLNSFDHPLTTIITGTAGEGKTFLCGLVWEKLGGEPQAWNENSDHFQIQVPNVGTNAATVTLHIIRDWSSWVPPQGSEWTEEQRQFMVRFAESIFTDNPTEIFLIAANDGQLREAFRRCEDIEIVAKAWKKVEDLLLDNINEKDYLRLFNLSNSSGAAMFDRALTAFLDHDGWKACYEQGVLADDFFGENCPIRKNYETLKEPLIRTRMMQLLELCDQNGLHVPIRQILILLSNAVLGHAGEKTRDNLLSPDDVPGVLASGTRHLASIYNNLFGGNLTDYRRAETAVFTYLEKFQIGAETSNRLDNILIFEESHEQLQQQYRRFIESDEFYGAVPSFVAAKRNYVEGGDEDPAAAKEFLDLLVSQRRALFFKIPEDEVEDLNLWSLTVFKFGGEYLTQILGALRDGEAVKSPLLARLVRGINRIFCGMLIGSERELLLASSASLSQARVCRFLEDKISVAPRRGEKVSIILEHDRPVLRVDLGDGRGSPLGLSLTRYEYLSRVAEGALPSSFSKECFEDLMAFKSKLMGELVSRGGDDNPGEITFRVLSVGPNGVALDEPIAVSV